MTIITFCPEPLIDHCRELLRFLDTSFSELPREHFNSLPELGMRLQQPRNQPHILVFLAPDHACLERLAALQREVQGSDLVLILPDGLDASLTLGHSLRPRLLTSLEEDVGVIEEVLARIIRRALLRGGQSQHPGGDGHSMAAA